MFDQYDVMCVLWMQHMQGVIFLSVQTVKEEK